MKKCIVCENEINDGATKCIHCNEYQNYRRYLQLPQNVLALLVALISVTTVLIPILRSSHTPISEEKVHFSWLFAGNTSITLLLHNESDEDAFIQEVYFFNQEDSSRLYLDRFNRKPVIPKQSITPYEIPVFGIDLIDFMQDLPEITLWINWRTAKKEYAYIFTFCDERECHYELDRLSPLLEAYGHYEDDQAVITDLYFGKSTPSGSVSEPDWQYFKDSVISKSFGGFTELSASGYWTMDDGAILSENTSVVRIVHGNSEQEFQEIDKLIALYKERFKQESVLLTRAYNSEIDFR